MNMHVTTAPRKDWRANLSSPLFDSIRIPSMASINDIATRLCAEHGAAVEAFKANRANFPSDEVLALRADILRETRLAGFRKSAVATWFGRKTDTIAAWYASMDEAAP